MGSTDVFLFPAPPAMAVKDHYHGVGDNAGDAARENAKDKPCGAAKDAEDKADAFFFGQTKGGGQAEDHADPIRSLVFE